MFKRFWIFLSSIGLKDEYDESLKKRITLINQFTFIALFVYIFSGLNNFTLGDSFSAIIIESFVLICSLGLYFNKLHYHKLATSFLFITVSSSIFYFDSYSGLNSGTYLYHFPLVLAIAFVFDVKTEKKLMLFYFGLEVVYIAVNVFTKYKLFQSDVLTDDMRYQMFAYNLLLSIAAAGFFIYLSVKNGLDIAVLYDQRIAEREASEKIIKQALQEKDILMTELHHRVKNNLAVIAGLFSLKLDSVENEDARNVLMESRNRVRSMALIHNRLYKSSNFADVNFEQYVHELIGEVKLSYPAISNSIAINLNIDNIILNVNTAIPCGLILNELLTNCYKHAFKGRTNGTIHVWFTKSNNHMTLIVRDNGVGLPPDYEKRESLGLTVIQSLSEQLDGKYKFTNENGACFELNFNYQNN